MGDRGHQIFQARHAGKQTNILKGTRHARVLGDAEIDQPLEQIIPPVRMRKTDHPDGRLIEPGDAVEHRSLARTVRPDDCGDVTASCTERQIVHRQQAAEAHGQVLDGEDRFAHPRPSSRASAISTGFSFFRNTEGVRVETSPRGRHIMIATMARPNTTIRYCWNSRKNSKPPSITVAAMATPIWEPMPPRTTIARTIADSWNTKDSGLINPCRVAKNEPAKPPNIAPIAKAVSLVLVVFMPSDRQAISSSRRASQARPIGRRRSRTVTKAVSSASARIT